MSENDKWHQIMRPKMADFEFKPTNFLQDETTIKHLITKIDKLISCEELYILMELVNRFSEKEIKEMANDIDSHYSVKTWIDNNGYTRESFYYKDIEIGPTNRQIIIDEYIKEKLNEYSNSHLTSKNTSNP